MTEAPLAGGQVNMDSVDPVFLMIAIAIFVVGYMVMAWQLSRAGEMLDGWAQSGSYEILSQGNCWFFQGPFSWTSSKGQVIYRVVVRDREGRTRSGYVRCGGFWLGIRSDHVEVRWDD